MDLFKRWKKRSGNVAFFLSDDDAYDKFTVPGYTRLDQNPEIMTACQRIAEVISMITIHIMANTDNGDKRIINALSEKIDINPYKYMTRSTWIQAVVMNLLLYGRGNSVVKVNTVNGILEDLIPVPASKVNFKALDDGGYQVLINGVPYDHDEVLHFVYNPDSEFMWKGKGVNVQLKDVANCLKQAGATKKGFLSSKWKPSIIVKVDALTEEFSGKEGRDKLLEEYLDSGEAGKPWLIPAEQFSVEQVKPLTLNDLAINDSITLDKRTVASILGVPPFILGVGEYKKEAWNSFINTTVKSIVIGLQQEMTKKLIISPKWYVKFNVLSLLDWDIKTIADVFGGLSDRGIVDGNEVRDKMGMSPREGLDELRVLENYIPFDMSGKQKKLIQEEGE